MAAYGHAIVHYVLQACKLTHCFYCHTMRRRLVAEPRCSIPRRRHSITMLQYCTVQYSAGPYWWHAAVCTSESLAAVYVWGGAFDAANEQSQREERALHARTAWWRRCRLKHVVMSRLLCVYCWRACPRTAGSSRCATHCNASHTTQGTVAAHRTRACSSTPRQPGPACAGCACVQYCPVRATELWELVRNPGFFGRGNAPATCAASR